MTDVATDRRLLADHDRAKCAASALSVLVEGMEDKLDNFLEAKKDTLKDYRTVVRNAGTAIRQIGLAQYTVFGFSKSDAHRAVLKDVYNWLENPAATATNRIAEPRDGEHPRKKLAYSEGVGTMNALLQRSSHEIMALEAEAQQYLTWLKRLTEGAYKSLERLAEQRKSHGQQQSGTPVREPDHPSRE